MTPDVNGKTALLEATLCLETTFPLTWMTRITWATETAERLLEWPEGELWNMGYRDGRTAARVARRRAMEYSDYDPFNRKEEIGKND
jgi:hypothetical protein